MNDEIQITHFNPKAIWGYPKVYNLGHPAIGALFDGDVFLQEKYDGSQLSWAWIDGELFVRSKGKMQAGGHSDTDKMFVGAVEYLSSIKPVTGYIFRGEMFNKPKHNTLEYDRIPDNGIILYDMEKLSAPNSFMSAYEVQCAAEYMGVEMARTLSTDSDDGSTLSLGILRELSEDDSSLGGPKMEGLVIKNYAQFTRDGKVMMGKLVSEEFKERHSVSWSKRHPTQTDVVDGIVAALNTEPRWQKAKQTLAEYGVLDGAPQDIGPLMVEVKNDTMREEEEWIKAELYTFFKKRIVRGIGRGLPEWYKAQLAEDAFPDA